MPVFPTHPDYPGAFRLRRIVVVCGYGCNLESPLKGYLDKVIGYCMTRHPDAILLCGGATQQKSFPGETEASVMYQYLKPLRAYHPMWYKLSDSYTTYDNIRDAAMAIRAIEQLTQTTLPDNEIVVFCEATRALKVAMLARHFIGFPPAEGGPVIKIETDSWELMHPTTELVGTVKEWLAIKFPFLNTIQRNARIRKSQNR